MLKIERNGKKSRYTLEVIARGNMKKDLRRGILHILKHFSGELIKLVSLFIRHQSINKPLKLVALYRLIDENKSGINERFKHLRGIFHKTSIFENQFSPQKGFAPRFVDHKQLFINLLQQLTL